MSDELKAQLHKINALKALLTVRDFEGESVPITYYNTVFLLDTAHGICDYLYENRLIKTTTEGSAVDLIMRNNVHSAADIATMSREWPKFSGIGLFPVPHPILSPEDAYMKTPNEWLDEYGENRLDLVRFLIEMLEEDYKNKQKTCQ